jgi:hypothetical protein
MEKEFIIGKIKKHIRDHGKTTRWVAKEF